MKAIRKGSAALLAAAMVLALSVAASAASGTNSSAGKITISNPVVGETYSVYQMFVLESYNTDPDGDADTDDGIYAYTISTSSPWWDFVKPADTETQTAAGAGAGYVALEEKDDSAYYVTWTDSSADAQAFAKAALAYAKSQSVTKTAYGKLKTENGTSLDTENSSGSGVAYNGGALVFSGLNLGYYLVDSSLGALVMLDTTGSEAAIEEKNAVPTVQKEVREDSTNTYGASNNADIGDTVTFRTTITAWPGAQNYVLHDQMSAGLTFGSVSSVTAGDPEADPASYSVINSANYSVSASGLGDGCTFEIRFAQGYLDTLTAQTSIVVTYTADVNSGAVIDGTGNTDATHLTYGDGSETATLSTATYVYDVDIFKYTTGSGNSATQAALPGASFVLYKTVNDEKYYAKVENGKLTGWTKNSSSERTEDPDDGTCATTLTSDADGNISVDGLDADDYYLLETAAPAGYNMLAEAVAFQINTSGSVMKDGAALTGDTLKIENKTGAELPSTGGIGTTVFYVVGAILVLGAAILLIVKRRMNGSGD